MLVVCTWEKQAKGLVMQISLGLKACVSDCVEGLTL